MADRILHRLVYAAKLEQIESKTEARCSGFSRGFNGRWKRMD